MDDRNAIARAEIGRELIIERELAEAVREVIASAESPNTRRACAAQIAKFAAWCQSH